MKPIGSKLAIRPYEKEERKESGIIIPGSVADKEVPQMAEVVAVGKDVEHIEEGDEVLYAKQANFLINSIDLGDDQEGLLIESEHVLAVIQR